LSFYTFALTTDRAPSQAGQARTEAEALADELLSALSP